MEKIDEGGDRILKVLVRGEELIIIEHWETLAEELFAFPECESLKEFLEFLAEKGISISLY